MAPSISVIIPAFESHLTVENSLWTLRSQTYPRFEVIVVDSSPSDRTEAIVPALFPDVRYIHSPQRLLPHAARNYGATLAAGELLAFTDPDIYHPPDWLAQMVEAYERSGGLIVGALACYGRRWLDLGIHFGKFDPILPGGPPVALDLAPSGSLLCSRERFFALGGFPDNVMLGDSMLGWQAMARGLDVLLQPHIVSQHDHRQTMRAYLRERYVRGQEFGRIRRQLGRWSPGKRLLWALVSVFPLRLTHFIIRGARNARRAGLARQFWLTLPVYAAGQAAWLLGESRGFLTTDHG